MKKNTYFPLVDVVIDGEWKLEENLTGSDHVRKSRPRAGGGTMFVPAGTDESERLPKRRALLDAKYGQPSKVGNIDAPIELFLALERFRIDLIGCRGGAYNDFSPEEIFGNPRFKAKQAVLSSINNDGSLDMVKLVSGLIGPCYGFAMNLAMDDVPKKSMDQLADHRVISGRTFWDGVYGVMASVEGALLHDVLETTRADLTSLEDQHFGALVGTIAGALSKAVAFARSTPSDELIQPKITAKWAKQVFVHLFSEKDHRSPSQGLPSDSKMKNLMKQQEITELDKNAQKQKERDENRRAERASREAEARGKTKRRRESTAKRFGDAGKSHAAKLEEAEEAAKSPTPKAEWRQFSMDTKDDTSLPSPWMDREKYEHDVHGRDAKVRQAVEDMVANYWGHNYTRRDQGFGDMVIIKMPLRKTQPARIRGRSNRASEFGRTLRHPHRLTTDGRVFSAKRKGVEGTVLIDNSGSMQLTTREIEEIVRLLPASTIALYSGMYIPDEEMLYKKNSPLPTENADRNGKFGGALMVIARDNKIAVPENNGFRNGWRSVPKYLGGGFMSAGNSIDGTALQWLAKQKAPRYWVSDGQVTGVERTLYADGTMGSRGDFVSKHLIEQCAKICLQAKILRVNSMQELTSMIEDRTIRYV